MSSGFSARMTVVFTFRTVVATVRDRLSRHALTAACASRRLHPVPSFFNSHALTLRSDTGASCFTSACTARVYLLFSGFWCEDVEILGIGDTIQIPVSKH